MLKLFAGLVIAAEVAFVMAAWLSSDTATAVDMLGSACAANAVMVLLYASLGVVR